MDKLIAISANGFFAIMALHWLPWEKLIGKKLPRPISYMIGVGVIGATFAAWCLWAQPNSLWTVRGFWIIVIAIGLGDLVAYGIDDWGGGRMDKRTSGRTQRHRVERD